MTEASKKPHLTVPVGKTPDGLYVMHKWAFEALMTQTQNAEDKAVKQAQQIAALRRIATGEVRHAYQGDCPGSLKGPEVRDLGCPACQILGATA